MENFIEQFYYGNIEPQARSTRTNKAMSTEMQTLSDSALVRSQQRIGLCPKMKNHPLCGWIFIIVSVMPHLVSGFLAHPE